MSLRSESWVYVLVKSEDPGGGGGFMADGTA